MLNWNSREAIAEYIICNGIVMETALTAKDYALADSRCMAKYAVANIVRSALFSQNGKFILDIQIKGECRKMLTQRNTLGKTFFG